MNSIFRPEVPLFISGFGFSIGRRLVTNRDFIEIAKLDISENSLTSLTGIRQRHYLSDDQSISDIATEAAMKAMASAQIDIHFIDRIILATSTGDFLSPSTASIVQFKLGGRFIPCHDLGAACSGFVYALDVAMRYLATGDKNILVIGADARSRTLDWSDPFTASLYGDGAGAFVLSSNTSRKGFQISASTLFSDTNGFDEVTVKSVGSALFNGTHQLSMPNGKSVMRNAFRGSQQMLNSLFTDLDITPESIAAFIFHQPNYRLLSGIAEKLGLPPAKIPCIFPEFGNTVAASIPMTFCNAVKNQCFNEGERIVLVAIGAGFSGGAIVLNQ